MANPDLSLDLLMKAIVAAWFFSVACGITEEDLKYYGGSAQAGMMVLRAVAPVAAAAWLLISKVRDSFDCRQGPELTMRQFGISFHFSFQFGIKIVYNGMLQTPSTGAHSEQRCEMIFKRGGERFKLETDDRNHIDTIFVDRRR